MAFSRNKNLTRTLTVNNKEYIFKTANERNAFAQMMAGDTPAVAGTYDRNIEVEAVVADGQTVQPGSFLIDVTPYNEGPSMLVQQPAADTAGQNIVGAYRGTEVANAGDTITVVIRGRLDMKVNGAAPNGAVLRLDNSEPFACSFGEANDSYAFVSKLGDPIDATGADYAAVFFNQVFITA
jgi:hypothetical protein